MKKTLLLLISLTISIMLCFAFTACGGDSEETETTEATQATETTEAIDLSELNDEQLASKAEELNQDESNFFGKWEATSPTAKNLYGFLEVTINEDGTVIMDMAEEHLEGTWEKVDGGIHFHNELFDGDCFYGKKCKMVIKEIEEDGEIKVTLTKVE